MSWLALLPPIVVFLLGFWTKRIQLSLFAGIVTAALVATGGAPLQAVSLTVSGIWGNLQLEKLLSTATWSGAGNFYILVFVLSLGVLVEMIRYCRAVDAFVNFATDKIRDGRAAESSALILSHCLCMDDYLSSLTVGSVMRPLTDRFRIPRAKLAFLTDSMAAPVSMVAPVSSWAAAIITFLIDNGIHTEAGSGTLLVANPYEIYLNTLPFVVYSVTLIISMWWIVRTRISFGTMHDYEKLAEISGSLNGGKPLPEGINEVAPGHSSKILDFIFPMATLLTSTFTLLLYTGGWSVFGGNNGPIAAMQQAPISQVLFISGLFSLASATCYYCYRGHLTLKSAVTEVFVSGMKLMLPVCVILLYAWTLGGLLREHLHVGEWLASLMSGKVPLTLMPLILFLNASIISMALGSSWATTAILVPIALPMVMSMGEIAAPATIEQMPILFPILGAILSGAVCGDHISLISETTIMAATSAGCDHFDHVKTQSLYALPIVIGSAAGFLAIGMAAEASYWVSIMLGCGISSAVSISSLTAAHFLKKKVRTAVVEDSHASSQN